jgi:RNA polymerase sigma factor (sigma-70 family)
MSRNSSIPHESFEEILAWLSPDRETAAAMYVQLRHDLAKIFVWRVCSDPEGLTDEVFDRVAKKVGELRPIYEGDPRHYFRAVAKNLIKENVKKVKTYVSLEDADLSNKRAFEQEEDPAGMDECLQLCLKTLSPDRRELILAYYAKEKQEKIENRNQLADSLGITIEALRVKVYRIRASLDNCIRRCLEEKVQ